MKAILEQYAARLTPEEKHAIWARIAEPARAARPFATARAEWLVTGVAAVAALAFVFAQLQRGPAVFWRPAPAERTPVSAPLAPVAPQQVAPAPATPPNAHRAPLSRPIFAPPVVALPLPEASVPASGSEPMPVPARERGKISGRVLDAHGMPVPYASVIVVGTRSGGMTDENGNYQIVGAPVGDQQVKVSAIGHDPQLAAVRVEPGKESAANLAVGDSKVVKTISEVEVQAERRIDTKSSSSKQSISAERLRGVPVDNLSPPPARKPEVAQSNESHLRGGRSGEMRQEPGVTVASPGVAASIAPAPSAPAPPVVPTTGGSALPNDEPFDSMFFKSYGVNPFVPTDEDALSTFAVDVDAASYTLTRRYLRLDQLPPADAVRVEEFVNFFPQGYPHFTHEDFRILVDGAPSAFGSGYQLLRVGLKGRELTAGARKSAVLSFVIDVSGSMAREDRLELVKRALRLLVDRLRDDDRVGIVVFGSDARVLLEPVRLGSRDDRDDEPVGRSRRRQGRDVVLDAIDRLAPEGATNTEQGLRLGYDMARRAYVPGANNRIVLCSDGVANVGVTGPTSILARVRGEADRGIQLTTVGFGMGNYNDVLMEQLADRGDGNHYYVDDLAEARRVFVGQADGTLETIARDAKVQVEFDSTRVLRWRLLGFENRDVADRDFRNDKVDAGEIGAGHEVTALYEVKLAPSVTRGTIATVRLRYAQPENEAGGAPAVREISQRFDASALAPRFADAAPAFRRDAAVAEFAEILRGSYWAKDGDLAAVLSVARSAAASLHEDASDEFARLVAKAADLRAKQAADPARREH